MISNVSGFILYSNGLFYISEERNDTYGITLNKSEIFEEIIREILPFNVIISIKKIGLIEFDFSNWSKTRAVPGPMNGEIWKPEKEWNVTKLRLLLMNVFLSIFYTNYENIHKTNLSKSVITSKQQITRSDFNSQNIGFGSSTSSNLYMSLLQDNPYLGILNWIKTEVIAKTIEDFKKLFKLKYKDFWYLIDNLSVAHINHQNNHYSQALIISWSVIESLLAKTWIENFILLKKFTLAQLEVSVKKFTRKHSYSGSNPKNYTSYIILRVLEDLLIFKKSKFMKIDAIREKRNNWIHELKEVKMKDSHNALNYAIEQLNEFIPVKLLWSANTSWYTG